MHRNSFSVQPKWLLRATIILVIALFSLMVTSTEGSLINVVPQTADDPAGLIDGDLNGDPDWESLNDARKVSAAIDLDPGKQDDSFGKGAKEDTMEPAIVAGSIPKNKSDLMRFYVADERVENEHFLYLAWVRTNTLGTANMDFEFNQLNEMSPNGQTPIRKDGDMLVTFDMGSVIRLGLSRWTDTGTCESSSSAPCWGPITDLSDALHAEGAVNTESTWDPIEGVTLAPLTFGEAAINLTTAGVFNSSECTNFGSAYLKSRSSDSFTAALKDFIAPQKVEVTNCGNIIVNKVTNPSGHAQSFDFTATGVDYAGFSLIDDEWDDQQRLRGTYTITEADTPGWYLEDLVCDDPSGDTTIDGATATIELDSNETVTCTYTNTQMGYIQIQIVTDPAGVDQDFGFTLSGGPSPMDPLISTLNAADTNVVALSSGPVLPGSGYVAEETLPLADGWVATGSTCDDRDGNSEVGNIDVSPGETVVCTFTYTLKPKLTVTKVVVTDDGGAKVYTDFPLFVGDLQVNSRDQNIFDVGDYAISEIEDSGYAAVFGGDCNAIGFITLAPGDVKTCTITNDDIAPTLKLVKTVTNDDGGNAVPDDWTLSASAPSPDDGRNFNNAGGSGVFQTVVSNAGYVLSETAVAGYTAGSFTCDGGSLVGQTITLTEGETGVTCTIDSDDVAPTLTLLKTVVNDDGGNALVSDFPLFVNGSPMTSGVSVTLKANTLYTASETNLAGYAPSDWGSDCAADGSITLNEGENRTCTITNDDIAPTLTVNKVLNPANDAGRFNLEIDGITAGTGANVGDGGSTGAVQVIAGNHIVGESAVTGTDLAEYVIVISGDCSVGGSVSLQLGDNKTCTITNTKRGHIIINKLSDPSGDSQSFSFDTTGGSYLAFNLADGQSNDQELAPGSYSVTEVGITGWNLTGLSCTDPDDGTTIIGATANIDLDPGETVTCTYTNKKQLFTIITLVCLDGQLYASSVVLDGELMTSLVALPDGLTGADLCGLSGARYTDREPGEHFGSVTIYPAP